MIPPSTTGRSTRRQEAAGATALYPPRAPARLLTAEEETRLASELSWATAEMTTIALASSRGRAELATLAERVEDGSLPVWNAIRRRGGEGGRALSETAARRQLHEGLQHIQSLSSRGTLSSCLESRRRPAPLGSPAAPRRRSPAACQQLERVLSDLQLTESAKARLVAAARGQVPPALAERLSRAERVAHRIRTRFVAANQGLVHASARSYANQGLSFSDLVQEGNLGLMRAIDKFDPDLGYRFSTYAVWWIRHAIRRALSNQSRTIRLPVHASEDRASIRDATERLRRQLGRAPSDAELAEAAGLSRGKLRDLTAIVGAPLSLDQTGDTAGRLRLAECLGDPDAEDPSQVVARKNARRWLLEHLSELSPREREMVDLRYGLTGRRALTLKEVGSEYGVTRERVRQIVGGALEKLRAAAQLDPVDSPS